MYGPDDNSATAVMPTPSAAGTAGWYQAGNPATNIPATLITADWLNAINAELLNVVSLGGLSPSKSSVNQVGVSISNMITRQLRYFYWASPTILTASSTTFLGPTGVSTSSLAGWIMPFGGSINQTTLNVSGAPTGTVTATIYKNGSAIAGAVSSLPAGSGTATTSVASSATFVTGDALAVQLVTGTGLTGIYGRGWFSIQAT